ncbi:hypothetical protein LCGC14_0614480 [marine sediment metagenome]|uniref:Uncharacterized protein n=1 Tax=marine sediment metagenome TaxID=412755 RepID=A0A0F9UF16_9ZZZZ
MDIETWRRNFSAAPAYKRYTLFRALQTLNEWGPFRKEFEPEGLVRLQEIFREELDCKARSFILSKEDDHG